MKRNLIFDLDNRNVHINIKNMLPKGQMSILWKPQNEGYRCFPDKNNVDQFWLLAFMLPTSSKV